MIPSQHSREKQKREKECQNDKNRNKDFRVAVKSQRALTQHIFPKQIPIPSQVKPNSTPTNAIPNPQHPSAPIIHPPLRFPTTHLAPKTPAQRIALRVIIRSTSILPSPAVSASCFDCTLASNVSPKKQWIITNVIAVSCVATAIELSYRAFVGYRRSGPWTCVWM